jgi:thiol-disulfide isomerase/thioredoxin
VATDIGRGVEAAEKAKGAGEACAADTECASAICYASKCAKVCTQPSECGTTQDCGSDDGKRIFCYDRTYGPKQIGASCAITKACPGTAQKCIAPGAGGAENAGAYCTGECTNDTDCPPTFYCREAQDKTKRCVKRGFCDRCLHDGQCEAGGKCVLQGKEKFCTIPCHAGSTECPRFAKCADGGGGSFQCVHKAGTCASEGKLCDPCISSKDCQSGGLCLTYVTNETFCGSDCGGASCPSSYQCEEIDSTSKQCTPTSDEIPSCVPLSPTMEPGDIMDDFAMVGYTDTNKDNALTDETTLKVIRLSDYANEAKVILLNVSAGWCGPCQDETRTFTSLMSTYGPKGLMIVQALFDTDTQGEPATVAFLKTWIKALKPSGASGVDPAWNSLPMNTDGSTPLNVLLDAKTRKVLSKFNTAAPLQSEIKKTLGL